MASRRLFVMTAAVVLAAVAVAIGAVTRLGRDSEGGVASTTTVIAPEVVDDFLADFERSLTDAFVVSSTFERQQGGEVVAADEVTVVQRPPDRLTVRTDSVSGRLDGRAVTCTGEGDDTECLIGSETVDAEAEVAEQVATLTGYVTGDDLLYGVAGIDPPEVTRVGGEEDRCYSLELLRQLPVAPYGTLARLCFDAESGAPTLLRVERPEAVDITRAVEVIPEVTDEDLRLPR